MAEFGKARYDVDVLKVEVPDRWSSSRHQGVQGREGLHARRGTATFPRRRLLTHKPFIYLSAGVSNPVFIETLELAGESGTNFNGVLCGRATWKDGIAIFAKQARKAFREWLNHRRRRISRTSTRASRAPLLVRESRSQGRSAGLGAENPHQRRDSSRRCYFGSGR